VTIEQYITEHSGLDKRRDYVGMSGIANCPRVIVDMFYKGVRTDYRDHLNAFRGYRIEKIAKEILIGAGIMKPNSERELAEFNDLVKGHTDGESVNGELIEIKSKKKEVFDQILASNKLPYRDFMQVQAYMHFGNYKMAIVFIICPETFETHTIRITPNDGAQRKLIYTLDRVIECINNKIYPACTCGRCNTQLPPTK
jgi:hypothetical protein